MKAEGSMSLMMRKMVVDWRFLARTKIIFCGWPVYMPTVSITVTPRCMALMAWPISWYFLEMMKNCTDWRALLTIWSSMKLHTKRVTKP